MATELRISGISAMGNVPWGTHFSHFYETKQDLLDSLVPYFKAGLENKEYCLWLISKPLTVEESGNALSRAVPDLDRYLEEQSIEIIRQEEWFLQRDVFDLARVMHGIREKLNQALARGYPGMRLSGNPGWLREKDRNAFLAYERALDELAATQLMLVSCTFPLATSGSREIFDMSRTHQVAGAMRHGKWQVVETPEVKQVKAEIKKLSEEYDERVHEQTRELATANEALIGEVTRHTRVEEGLRNEKEILQKIFDHVPVMINFFAEDGRVKLVNRAWERTLGWSLEELQRENLDIFAECYPDPEYRQQVLDFIASASGKWADLKTRVRDGRVIDTMWAVIKLSDGTAIGIGQDITERKQLEETLRQAQERTESILASVADIHIIFDRQWRYVYVNEAALRSIGRPREQLLEKSLWEVYPDILGTELETGYRRTMDERVPVSLEYYYPTSDTWWENRFYPVREGLAVFATDITERKRAEEALRITTEQLRALSASLSSAREEEGTRIARELHDELGSSLTILKWELEEVDRLFSKEGDQTNISFLKEKIAAMTSLADGIIRSVRRISSELRPSILDDLGLVAAIEWHAQQFEARTGIGCAFNSSLENADLSREQATAVFRIFQEAMTNVLRHAQATRVDIMIKQDEGEVVLEVRDNGRGITEDEKAGSRSLGLIGMRERARLAGGRIEMTGVAEKGTLLTVRVPIPTQASR